MVYFGGEVLANSQQNSRKAKYGQHYPFAVSGLVTEWNPYFFFTQGSEEILNWEYCVISEPKRKLKL